MNEKALTTWFRKRRESSVLDLAKEHLLKVLDTAREMDTAIKCASSGDREDALKAVERVVLAEKAADNIEVRMTETLSAGDIPPKEREDIMHLVKRLDYIADWLKSGARNMQIIMESGMEIPSDVWAKYRVITLKSVTAVSALKAQFDNLGVNHLDLARYAKDVDRLEHEVDDDYFSIKKELMVSSLDARVVFVLRDMLHSLENALDNVKRSSELILIITTASG